RFLGAAATPGGGPSPDLPAVAIAGRSTVGKSALITALLGRRGRARTTAPPARPRQLRCLRVTDACVLVALPRYGSAARPVAAPSTVGKSSLVNALPGRRGLARTSATPGRTRQLNFFLVSDAFVLVDLPGYGFAAGPETERLAWGPLVETYLVGRPTLRGVLLVVDARRGLEGEEEDLLAYLAALPRPATVVATKLDK